MPQKRPQRQKQKTSKSKKARSAKVESPSTYKSTYKLWCDNHPDVRAAYSFTVASTGERRGLCLECFEAERDTAQKRLARKKRIQKARARRGK